jgi:hypothetical protein
LKESDEFVSVDIFILLCDIPIFNFLITRPFPFQLTGGLLYDC